MDLCGGPHDSKSCKKSRETPAKCALCSGSHPSNYKGCEIYKNLIEARNRNNPLYTSKNTAPTQAQPNTQQSPTQKTASYAQATAGLSEPQTSNANLGLEQKFTQFLDEFKTLFNQLLNQNSMILNMLTTVISRISN